ncbi:MAG: hypothetical protein MUE99_12305, partial [Chitinophagaceae bacterium]|nr:hypothetical protein [Chitinophagaceae bacterium]
MTTQFTFAKLTLLLGSIILTAISCSKEDIVKPAPVDNNSIITKAQFYTEAIEIEEGFKSYDVDILLSPKPNKAGTITVILEDLESAVYQQDYITIPGKEDGKIILSVQPGSEKVSFRIMSADDDLHNQPRSIKLTMEQSASAHIKPEGKISSLLTLLDNENYSKIGFVESRSWVYENEQSGKEVTLKIEPAAKGNGYIDIDINMNGVVYGQQFTTLPAAINGKVRVMVKQGQQTATFKVIPVNDYFMSSTKI